MISVRRKAGYYLAIFRLESIYYVRSVRLERPLMGPSLVDRNWVILRVVKRDVVRFLGHPSGVFACLFVVMLMHKSAPSHTARVDCGSYFRLSFAVNTLRRNYGGALA